MTVVSRRVRLQSKRRFLRRSPPFVITPPFAFISGGPQIVHAEPTAALAEGPRCHVAPVFHNSMFVDTLQQRNTCRLRLMSMNSRAPASRISHERAEISLLIGLIISAVRSNFLSRIGKASLSRGVVVGINSLGLDKPLSIARHETSLEEV